MTILPALAFLVSVAYLPWAVDATQSGRWAVLALFVPAALLARTKIGPGHVLWAALLAWMAVGALWSVSPFQTIGELLQWLSLGAAFCVAAACPDLRRTWQTIGFGVAVSAAVCIAQRFGWAGAQTLSSAGAGTGLFLSKNGMGEFAVVALVVLVFYREWWGAAACAVCLATIDPAREVWLAIIAVGAWMVWCALGWRGRALGAAFSLGALAAVWATGLLDAVSLRPWLYISDRLEIWGVAWDNITWTGFGLGAFQTIFSATGVVNGVVPLNYEYAHNELLHYAFDLGIVGAALMAGIVVYALHKSRSPEAAGLVALLACCAVWFPLHAPATAFLGALVCGHLCGWRDRARAAQHRRSVRRIVRPEDAWPLGIGSLHEVDLRRQALPVRPQPAHRA